ncbi:UDP-glucose:undecaprenyl-phosphate glucose-1-phosphate transferase [Burkholderia cenocepacia]|uniref:undecaprenyl-phosphate glucose phosphotransferase n=1 Tax=Burkholderia cenocepacia TaxID=95486 RepID=UPI0003C4A19C|nr:undecaprenyl-phosphate glucose phosphotransferase [Burkholderia cenocepacia]ESS38251.1 Undecaprenyl-phosphate galactosephosphotransferase [Burkholderia cenocepacia KC-01]QND98154.1 UDP-glucose:undecaprenyl-phosphate glucose-1-phosphate transferase [Burkholderia cenocepacia]
MRLLDSARHDPIFRKTIFRGTLLDVCLLVVAAVVARSWIGEWSPATLDYLMVAISVPLAWIVFSVAGPHVDRVGGARWRAAGMALAGPAIVVGTGFATAFALDGRYWPVPGWVVVWFALSAAGLAALRALRGMWTRWRGRAAKRHATREAVGIVGHGALYDALAKRGPDASRRVEAVFDTSGLPATSMEGVRSRRSLARFVKRVRREGVGEIWIVLPLSDADRIGELVRVFRNELVDIRFVPELTGMAPFETRPASIADMPALDLVASPLSMRARIGKALFDRVFACVALIAIAPALAAIAVAVKLSSPGPVLFRQRRMGAYGRIFSIYKFRTMHVHHAATPGEVRQATRGDPRVTRIGALLRRTSLDELPQFFNVLKGDMSVVGPRPHAVEHDNAYRDLVDGYIHRYRVKPGITGWAQVNGLRGETDRVEKMRKRVEHDLYYLNNWSFSMDLRIVAATIRYGFTHRNAY